MPRPSGAGPQRGRRPRAAGSPKNSVPPPSSSCASARRRTPIVADETPPIPFSVGLPRLRVEIGEERAQVGEVDEREALARRRSGRRARGSAPASRSRRAPSRAAAARSRRPTRASARPGRCRRARGTRPGTPVGSYGRPELGHPLRRGAVGGARLARGPRGRPCSPPRTRDAGRRELLGEELEGDRLARFPSPRRRGRGGSSSRAGSARPRRGASSPSWTPRPRSIAGPSTAYAAAIVSREAGQGSAVVATRPGWSRS